MLTSLAACASHAAHRARAPLCACGRSREPSAIAYDCILHARKRRFLMTKRPSRCSLKKSSSRRCCSMLGFAALRSSRLDVDRAVLLLELSEKQLDLNAAPRACDRHSPSPVIGVWPARIRIYWLSHIRFVAAASAALLCARIGHDAGASARVHPCTLQFAPAVAILPDRPSTVDSAQHSPFCVGIAPRSSGPSLGCVSSQCSAESQPSSSTVAGGEVRPACHTSRLIKARPTWHQLVTSICSARSAAVGRMQHCKAASTTGCCPALPCFRARSTWRRTRACRGRPGSLHSQTTRYWPDSATSC